MASEIPSGTGPTVTKESRIAAALDGADPKALSEPAAITTLYEKSFPSEVTPGEFRAAALRFLEKASKATA